MKYILDEDNLKTKMNFYREYQEIGAHAEIDLVKNRTGSFKNQTGSLPISDDDSGCQLDEYAWVPPGLTPKQVNYFKINSIYATFEFFQKFNEYVYSIVISYCQDNHLFTVLVPLGHFSVGSRNTDRNGTLQAFAFCKSEVLECP